MSHRVDQPSAHPSDLHRLRGRAAGVVDRSVGCARTHERLGFPGVPVALPGAGAPPQGADAVEMVSRAVARFRRLRPDLPPPTRAKTSQSVVDSNPIWPSRAHGAETCRSQRTSFRTEPPDLAEPRPYCWSTPTPCFGAPERTDPSPAHLSHRARTHAGAAPREARRGSGRGGGGDAADDVGAGAAAAVAARLRGASLALRRRVAGGAAPASARLVRLRAAAPLGLRPGQPAGEGGDCGPHAADAVPARASSPGFAGGASGTELRTTLHCGQTWTCQLAPKLSRTWPRLARLRHKMRGPNSTSAAARCRPSLVKLGPTLAVQTRPTSAKAGARC